MKGLRFDKVAQRLVSDVQRELREVVPDGKVLVFTVTAPIWQASKTAAELEEKIRGRLARRPATMNFSAVIHENDVRVRLITGDSKSRIIGYVHNRDVDTDALFELARSETAR